MTFFQSYTDYKAQNAQVINALGKRICRAHSRRPLKDPNGQIVDKCSLKLQTKFREDPTVNESGEAFFTETVSCSFLEKLPRGLL